MRENPNFGLVVYGELAGLNGEPRQLLLQAMSYVLRKHFDPAVVATLHRALHLVMEYVVKRKVIRECPAKHI